LFSLRLSVCALSCLLVVGLAGCTSFGPGTITRDRFDYVSTISDSWKSQMLLNLVKLRYADTPVFLDVSSVISQYEFAGELSASLGWDSPEPGANSQTLGGAGRYAERPTITYVPLAGADFTQSLLTPVPPSAVLMLIQAGYPVRLVFGMCVRTINDLDNRSVDPLWAREADPAYERLVDELERLQRQGAVAMRVEQLGDDEVVVMALRRKRISPEGIERVADLLGIDPSVDRYRIAYGAVARSDDEIAIHTRSIFEIMVELSARVEPPPEHLRKGFVSPIAIDQTAADFPFRVFSGTEKPAEAYAAVRYLGHWFWIAQNDEASKIDFVFLMLLFSLVEPREGDSAPIVTVPAS
jgi:hypothetical protein